MARESDRWDPNDDFAESYGRSSITGGMGRRGSSPSRGGRPGILRNSIVSRSNEIPTAAVAHTPRHFGQSSMPTATAVEAPEQQDGVQGLGVGIGVHYEDAYAAQASAHAAAAETRQQRHGRQRVSFEATPDGVAAAMKSIDDGNTADFMSHSPYGADMDHHPQQSHRNSFIGIAGGDAQMASSLYGGGDHDHDEAHHHPHAQHLEQAQHQETPSMKRRSTLSLPPAPLPRETDARPPSPSHVEPAMPSPKFNRRFLKKDYQRMPDLCRGKLLSEFQEQKQNGYSDEEDEESRYVTLKCHNCRNVLQVSKSAILVKCSVCKQVHPA